MPAANWLREGFSRELALLALVVAPFFWSGPLRAVTGLSLPLTLALSLVWVALLALPLRSAWQRAADDAQRRRRWLLAGALVLCALFSVALLFNRWFGGLAVIVDGDSGTHVAIRDRFATVSPKEYFGFVSFYGVSWWAERLVHSAFVGFAVGFYLAVVVWAGAPIAATGAVLSRDVPPRRWRAAFAAAVGAQIVLLYFFALPLLHYHQAEGFFGHLFGVVPLAGLWLADGYVRAPRLRLVMLGVGVVAYRFTYGLNLGDLLVVFAALVLLDARHAFAGALGRLGCAVVALAALAAAFSCYQRLEPLWALSGWIIAHDLRRALTAQWVLVAVESLALCWPAARRRIQGRGMARWLRLPVLFGAVNAAALTWFAIAPRPQLYYVVKYGLHAELLLVAAIVPLLAALIAGPATTSATATAREPRAQPLTGVATLLIAAGLTVGAGLASRAIAVYRPGFLERAFGRPPFHILHPLADLGAWMRIERTLKREHKQFGGYLTTYYPVMNFMNAAFGYPNGGIHFYYGRPPLEGPGYCDFWEGGPPATWLEGDFPQRRRRALWSSLPDKKCVSYRASWDPNLVRTLCWFCR